MQSTLYTIGTALNRARDHRVQVRVLVSGHWIEGLVSDLDGHGVILTCGAHAHHVIRVQDIAAVTVEAGGPLSDDPLAPRVREGHPPPSRTSSPDQSSVRGESLALPVSC